MYDFTVEYGVTGTYSVHVAASNEAEAIAKAEEVMARSLSLDDLDDYDVSLKDVY